MTDKPCLNVEYFFRFSFSSGNFTPPSETLAFLADFFSFFALKYTYKAKN